MNRLFVSVVAAFAACTTAAPRPAPFPAPAQDAASLQPPVAPQKPKDVSVHGDPRTDEYFWLREKDSQPVLDALRAEAAYAKAATAGLEPLRKKLYAEMLARIQESDASVPFREVGFDWWQRTEKGKQYPIYLRRRPGGPEEVVLDQNRLAEGKAFLGLGAMAPSPDGSKLAFSVDDTGFRQFALEVKDLGSGKLGPERIPRVDSFAWGNDGRTLFYVVEDPVAKRPFRLYRHTLGSPQDALLFEEKDERFNLGVARSRDRKFLFVTSQSHTASEIRFFAADQDGSRLSLVEPRRPDHEYDVEHRGDRFYIRTNDRGRNFRLVTAPEATPDAAHWRELVAHREDVYLTDFDVFRELVVLHERTRGLPGLTFLDDAGARRAVSFPEPAYELSAATNREFDARAFRIAYSSFVTPQSVFDVDFATSARTLLKEQPVPGYDRSRYEVERLFVRARDGVEVPVSLVHRKGFARDGRSPLFLYAYGSYGLSMPDAFASERFSLIDRGVTFAIAHIRGGGEMGKKWHDDGRMFHKKNTFTDFVDCAEALVAQGYAAKDRIAIAGASAGGLLMGAVLNLRPDLFRVAVVGVPFVDVVNTMLDESLPLTVGEFEEWGNPKKPDEYRYIRSYSPYDNLEAKAYPAMLVKSSYNDSQVMYWEPAKYVARLRRLRTDRNPLVFDIKLEPAGHGGASGRYDRLRDNASDYAFVLSQLGIRD